MSEISIQDETRLQEEREYEIVADIAQNIEKGNFQIFDPEIRNVQNIRPFEKGKDTGLVKIGVAHTKPVLVVLDEEVYIAKPLFPDYIRREVETAQKCIDNNILTFPPALAIGNLDLKSQTGYYLTKRLDVIQISSIKMSNIEQYKFIAENVITGFDRLNKIGIKHNDPFVKNVAIPLEPGLNNFYFHDFEKSKIWGNGPIPERERLQEISLASKDLANWGAQCLMFEDQSNFGELKEAALKINRNILENLKP